MIDLQAIQRLISAATTVEHRREIEQDRVGPLVVNILYRPHFEQLQHFAVNHPLVLAAVFVTNESSDERRAIGQALSYVTDESIIPFWSNLIELETDQELLACAAIGLGRLHQADLLAKLEAKTEHEASLRLIFHLGLARLLFEDARGIDHLVELLRREGGDDPSVLEELPTHGPTMRFSVLSLLERIFPKGPGDKIAEWIPWWDERRHQYKWVNCSALFPELAYRPPLSEQYL